MEKQLWCLLFFTAFILNVGISDCQLFPDILIGNILNSISPRCQAPAWNPAAKFIQPQGLKIYIYSRGKFHIYPISEAPARLANSSMFNPELKTAIFVNGYRCPPEDKVVSDLADAFEKRGGMNFLMFDFYSYAQGEFVQYFQLVIHTSPLSKHLSNFLIGLTEIGVSRKNIQLVGYSYGGQIAGIAGLLFRREVGKPIARITALDPTTLCFPEFTNNRLRLRSAKFVDVIQTSVLGSGVENMGHVTFIVNNNRQPGCEADFILCVHGRSFLLYIESILNENSLLAVKCDNWNKFINGKCRNNIISPIGSRTDIKGKFFLKTGVKPPYGIGRRGIN